MNENQKKSYYAIIPANIRYDPNLTANAKLLYGEITALCNERGYCWATNRYFSDLYSVSEKTITRWINDLKEKKYIYTKIEIFRSSDGTISKKRYILLNESTQHHMDKNVHNHTDINVQNHTDKIVSYNNTSINNTFNNNKDIDFIDFIDY